MMKKNKTIFIFLGILLILAASYFILISFEKEEEQTNLTPSEVIDVFSISRSNLSSITIKNTTEEYSFSYEGEKPTLVGKESASVDITAIDSLSYELGEMKASMVVAQNAQSLETYGFTKDEVYVSLKEKDGKITTAYLGSRAPGGNGYYMKINDESKVYLIPIHKGEIFLKTSGAYRQTKFFELNKDDITKIKITKQKKDTIEFVKNQKPEGVHNVFSVYNMTSPYNVACEGSEVNKILDSLINFQVIDYVEDDPIALDNYGLNPYTYMLEVEHKGTKHNIYLGKTYGAKRYVRVDNDKGVYGISNELFGYLDLEPTAFIQKLAYIKNIDTVSKVSYNHIGGARGSFGIKSIGDENHEIIFDGKPMNQKDFKSIYTELISINIAGTVKNDKLGEVVLEYSFTFNDGTKDEVKYYKIDERKYALSVNDVVQFYVAANDLNDRIIKIDNIINQQ